jgi:hypothetical protein
VLFTIGPDYVLEVSFGLIIVSFSLEVDPCGVHQVRIAYVFMGTCMQIADELRTMNSIVVMK